jgi:hypothetical protein
MSLIYRKVKLIGEEMLEVNALLAQIGCWFLRI